MWGMEAVYKIPGQESYVTESPIEDLRVTVINQVPELVGNISLEMIHRRADVDHPTPETWIFKGALMPGQGFTLKWLKTT